MKGEQRRGKEEEREESFCKLDCHTGRDRGGWPRLLSPSTLKIKSWDQTEFFIVHPGPPLSTCGLFCSVRLVFLIEKHNISPKLRRQTNTSLSKTVIGCPEGEFTVSSLNTGL